MKNRNCGIGIGVIVLMLCVGITVFFELRPQDSNKDDYQPVALLANLRNDSVSLDEYFIYDMRSKASFLTSDIAFSESTDASFYILDISGDWKTGVYTTLHSDVLYYAEGKRTWLITENGKYIDGTKDLKKILYKDEEERLHLWTRQKDVVIPCEPEDWMGYADVTVGFSENGRYMACYFFTYSKEDIIWLYDTEEDVVRVYRDSGAIILSVGDDGSVLCCGAAITAGAQSLRYIKDGVAETITTDIKNAVFYAECNQLVYLNWDGCLYRKDLTSGEEIKVADDVESIYAIGKDYHSVGLWHGETRNGRYLIDETVDLFDWITDTAVEGILFRKDGSTWYSDLEQPGAQKISDKDIKFIDFQFAAADRLYYAHYGSLYEVQREGDFWTETKVSDHAHQFSDTSSFYIYDNGDGVLYIDEDYNVYVYTDGKETLLTESVYQNGLYGSQLGAEIIYQQEGCLYYMKNREAEPVLVAEDVQQIHIGDRGDSTEGTLLYYGPLCRNGFVYYMNTENSLIRVNVKNNHKKLLVENVNWYHFLWDE